MKEKQEKYKDLSKEELLNIITKNIITYGAMGEVFEYKSKIYKYKYSIEGEVIEIAVYVDGKNILLGRFNIRQFITKPIAEEITRSLEEYLD